MSAYDGRRRFTGAGSVEWIGVRTHRQQPIEVRQQVQAIEGCGLEGDHAAGRRGGKRQVTLIQAEHFPAIGQLAAKPPKPELLRRNLVVSGINLRALVGRKFQIGSALLEGTGDCPPCRSMERALGSGGCDAMAGMGGVTARVLKGGPICIGDAVAPYNPQPQTERLI